MPILLLADIGNTSIKIALSSHTAILHTYSFPSTIPYSVDSLGLALTQALSHAGFQVADIEAVLVCSVVPDVDTLFAAASVRFLAKAPLRFPDDFQIAFENAYAKPAEVGADRLLAAFAARRLYPDTPAVISVDYGTATTFDCVSGNAYLGGLICPGLLSSHKALATGTAKLPRISLEVQESSPLVGKSTATSMSHGFIFGFAAMTKGLVEELRHQLPSPCPLIATGGFAADIARVCPSIEMVKPHLILEGLLLAWQEKSNISQAL